MRSRLKQRLDAETLRTLQGLIEINLDNHDGYVWAAGQVDNRQLARLFREVANTRRAHAAALEALIDNAAEAPVDGCVYRRILDWKDAAGQTSPILFKKVLRAEAYVKAKYEAALTVTVGSPATQLLERQYMNVRADFDRIVAAVDRYGLLGAGTGTTSVRR